VFYVTKSYVVDAIKFNYSDNGLKELQKFVGVDVARHGSNRLPTMGGFAYVRLPDQILVINDGDYVVKWVDSGKFENLTEKDFLKRFTPQL
jgi:hypothetical protein